MQEKTPSLHGIHGETRPVPGWDLGQDMPTLLAVPGGSEGQGIFGQRFLTCCKGGRFDFPVTSRREHLGAKPHHNVQE